MEISGAPEIISPWWSPAWPLSTVGPERFSGFSAGLKSMKGSGGCVAEMGSGPGGKALDCDQETRILVPSLPLLSLETYTYFIYQHM